MAEQENNTGLNLNTKADLENFLKELSTKIDETNNKLAEMSKPIEDTPQENTGEESENTESDVTEQEVDEIEKLLNFE